MDSVLCKDELKLAMLAQATLYPAFLCFALNSVRTSAVQSAKQAARHATKLFYATGNIAATDHNASVGDDSITYVHSPSSGSSKSDGRSDNLSSSERKKRSPKWLHGYLEGSTFEVLWCKESWQCNGVVRLQHFEKWF